MSLSETWTRMKFHRISTEETKMHQSQTFWFESFQTTDNTTQASSTTVAGAIRNQTVTTTGTLNPTTIASSSATSISSWKLYMIVLLICSSFIQLIGKKLYDWRKPLFFLVVCFSLIVSSTDAVYIFVRQSVFISIEGENLFFFCIIKRVACH